MGLQTRLSPSFFSRIKGVLFPFDVTGCALEATPARTAQAANAIRAALMDISLGLDVFPVP
jgi:hypothetical protein